MIIDYARKCNTNNANAVTEEEFKGFRCPKCHTQGLDDHGTYKRWAISLETDGFAALTQKVQRLTICRGKCGSCGKTHAILPGDIIPYKQYSLDTVVTVLSFVLQRKLTVECVEKMLRIPHQVIYEILNQWSAMLLRLALWLRVIFQQYTITGADCDKTAILQFVSENTDRASKSYLKYFKWPMFMTRYQNAIPQKAFIGISE